MKRPRGRIAATADTPRARRRRPQGPSTRPACPPPSSLRKLQELLARSGGTGIDTSEGLLFNHTLWARDRAITALDVLDHRPEAARQSILALARLQGTARHFRSEEEPGRIHSEHRDFRRWQAPLSLKLAMRLIAAPLWGGGSASYTSYFAADSTPLYLMMVSQYAKADPGILAVTIERRDGTRVTVRDSVMLAAGWLLEHLSGDGLIEIAGRNPLSLPSPVWRDSPTSNLDEQGRMPNILEPIAWLDMQLLTFAAFRGLAAMLRAEAAETALLLDDLADVIRAATLRDFWMADEQYFGFAVDRDRRGRRRLLRAVQSNAGWLLDGDFFDGLPAGERARYVGGIVRTLFSPDMLTDAGVRGRSLRHALPGFLNYHEPVWPLDSLWIARGVRRQGLPELAEQLEDRVLNAVNALGVHYEFIPIDPEGRIVDPTLDRHLVRTAGRPGRPLPSEMVPDVDLAWSVTGVLRVKWERAERARAKRGLATRDPAPDGDRCRDAREPWAVQLTVEIMARIENVPALKSRADLHDLRSRFSPRYLSHWSGLLRSGRFILLRGLGQALPAAYLGRLRARSWIGTPPATTRRS